MQLQHGTLLHPAKLSNQNSLSLELGLISPYGDELVELLVDESRARRLRQEAIDLPSLDLDQRQLCSLELLMTGAFSPLRGFMNRLDYASVLSHMHTADGLFWPMPVTLDVSERMASQLRVGSRVALRDGEGVMLAVLTVNDVWMPDKEYEAHALYATSNPTHVGVSQLMQQNRSYYVGGSIEGVSLPVHYDYLALRHTPQQLREKLLERGWSRVAAFQACNPLNRIDHEIAQRIAHEYEAKLLVHPLAGTAAPDNVDYFNKIRCYLAVMDKLPKLSTQLALLPLSMRMAGIREILWHAIIHRNYGCSHFIVGGKYEGHYNGAGYESERSNPNELQEVVANYQGIVGVKIISFPSMVYVEGLSQFMPQNEIPFGKESMTLSEVEFRRRLARGVDIPEGSSFPDVIDDLRKFYPPRSKQGFTIFFTGLSGAGKSTLAKILLTRLMEIGGRQVSLLDGDLVRKHLSSELGFSKEHRDINVQRIGYVSSEITKHRGIAICAPIAPYRETRRMVRSMIEPHGGFFEVYIATPLEVCEQRDCKGLYAKARAGIIKEFTGVSDPYEVPEAPEITLDTSLLNPEEAVQLVLQKLENEGYI